MTIHDDMKQWMEALIGARNFIRHADSCGDHAAYNNEPQDRCGCGAQRADEVADAAITSLRARITAVDGDVSPAEAARRAHFGAGRHGHPEWATLDKQSRATWGRVADAVLTAAAPKEEDHE